MKTLIQNSKYIATMNDKMEEWNGGHILIENDKIISIGKNNLKGDFDQIID
ncbi:MAG: 8-oxoguanine deaminase, partial [Candidatus Cloacimonetes bacterium]|nr:8-oxoguanine deaminase [Candidatus Cloacimonadota bacterium]